MTGFVLADLKVQGATVSGFAPVSGGAAYDFVLWPTLPVAPSTTRSVQVIIPAATSNDTATNPAAASTLLQFNYNSASSAFVVN